jgi:hypothetical protein
VPNLKITVRSDKVPDLFVSRKVETFKELRRFFREADEMIGKVAKVFPAEMDSKISTVSITRE